MDHANFIKLYASVYARAAATGMTADEAHLSSLTQSKNIFDYDTATAIGALSVFYDALKAGNSYETMFFLDGSYISATLTMGNGDLYPVVN